ncbi:uracil-DNA glycosylase [Burkholderia glumae]|uniref:uracil-DNA glycosylase n=2 Tax=Burkholderia glumae TaxID=337 RepID=UPI000F5F769F|nr:uracil-DNA glycosylase [Burkholderia glumae]MCQ0030248.1 uracil-DNA glycosylase [Burkholderia glumae]QJW77987.1 uracil-DNA glycosylase [Burkholderia glumae]RQZ76702.1 uracil-DNA glycosylase [Burkholderia glumae]UVS86770.1 uracil-DNA glycosylase [Burkholderia glumae]
MSWLDSALDEMGLGPLWVRRSAADAPAAAEGAVALADDGAAPMPGAALARPAAGQRPAASATRDASEASEAPLPPAGTAAHEAVPPRGEPAHAGARAASAASLDAAAEAHSAPAAARRREARPDTAAPAGAADQMPPDADPSLDDPSWFDLVPMSDAGHSFEPAEPAVARSPVTGLGWDELEARVAECRRCRLCEKRTRTVFGVGDREADWMLIGEAPGENEDKQGEPFVGQAGKLLDSMLHALSLKRGENVYIANVIKCRPPGNRNPEPDEVARCEPYLQRQVELVKPKLIVAMGRFAAQTLLKSTGSIASMRGRIHHYEGVPVVVSYHPAYLLRSLPDKAKAWADLCLARDTIGGAGKAAGDA